MTELGKDQYDQEADKEHGNVRLGLWAFVGFDQQLLGDEIHQCDGADPDF